MTLWNSGTINWEYCVNITNFYIDVDKHDSFVSGKKETRLLKKGEKQIVRNEVCRHSLMSRNPVTPLGNLSHPGSQLTKRYCSISFCARLKSPEVSFWFTLIVLHTITTTSKICRLSDQNLYNFDPIWHLSQNFMEIKTK